jgi:hypothetical protein
MPNPKLKKEKRDKINGYITLLLDKHKFIKREDLLEFFWTAFFSLFEQRKNNLNTVINDCRYNFREFEWKIVDYNMVVNQVFCAYKVNRNVELLTNDVMEYDTIINIFEGRGLDYRLDINFQKTKYNILVEVTIPLEDLITNFKKKVVRTKIIEIFKKVR